MMGNRSLSFWVLCSYPPRGISDGIMTRSFEHFSCWWFSWCCRRCRCRGCCERFFTAEAKIVTNTQFLSSRAQLIFSKLKLVTNDKEKEEERNRRRRHKFTHSLACILFKSHTHTYIQQQQTSKLMTAEVLTVDEKDTSFL